MPADTATSTREFQTLANVGRVFQQLQDQAARHPAEVDPVVLLSALGQVGEASLALLEREGAL